MCMIHTFSFNGCMLQRTGTKPLRGWLMLCLACWLKENVWRRVEQALNATPRSYLVSVELLPLSSMWLLLDVWDKRVSLCENKAWTCSLLQLVVYLLGIIPNWFPARGTPGVLLQLPAGTCTNTNILVYVIRRQMNSQRGLQNWCDAKIIYNNW